MCQAAATAQEFGGQVEQKLIHQTFADQRPVELVASFDVQFIDLAARQIAQHGGQIDLAFCARRLARHGDDSGAEGFQCGLPLGVGDGTVDEDPARQPLGWRLEQPGVQGCFQSAVDHHQVRLTWRVHHAHIEHGVVFLHGAHAGQHRTSAGTPGMAIGARRFAGDPLARAVVQRGGAIE
ncbi:hypothetical protein FQZ97_991480 [compost metagenome]